MSSMYRSDPATEPVRIVGYRKPRTSTVDDVATRRQRNRLAARPDPMTDPRMRYVDFLADAAADEDAG